MSEPPQAPDARPAGCHRCGLPPAGFCRLCGKPFCHLHGGPGMSLCRGHWALTAAIGLGVVMLLIGGALVAAAMRAQQ